MLNSCIALAMRTSIQHQSSIRQQRDVAFPRLTSCDSCLFAASLGHKQLKNDEGEEETSIFAEIYLLVSQCCYRFGRFITKGHTGLSDAMP